VPGTYATAMSSIASLYLLREPDVQALAGSGAAPDELELRDVFHWSGYFMLYLLLFLEEQEVPVSESRYDDLLSLASDQDTVRYLLTSEHQAHLARLEFAAFDLAAFDEYLDEMGGTFEEAPIAVEETLALLREQVAGLREDQALLIEIG
jgi:hypothetical protein